MKAKLLINLLCLTGLLLGITSCTDNKTVSVEIPKISVQLWSVKDEVKQDFDGTLKILADMGFDGVEFAGEFGPYTGKPKQLKASLDANGLSVSGAHVPLDQLDSENFASTVAFYQAIGCNLLIIPYDVRASSPTGVPELAAELDQLSIKLAKHDMLIGYHNHTEEFDNFEQATFWDFIAQSTNKNVVMQLDVGWTSHAGKDPVEYVKRYPGRTLTTHYKADLGEDNPNNQGKLPIIGQDNTDWLALIRANMDVGGTQWFVIEQEAYPNDMDPLAAVKASKQGLDTYLQKL